MLLYHISKMISASSIEKATNNDDKEKKKALFFVCALIFGLMSKADIILAKDQSF